ncbi:MAG: SMP-30/gluconolactonase/LRE family protein [Acidobacteria bacterium]|nr:SMP-30/gluconolactonase/LRE family protein [Acidobacteriota bacterium]
MRNKAKALVVVAGSLVIGAAAAGQAPGGRQGGPTADPSRVLTSPDIPGVVKGGTKVEFIRAGFNGTEGVIAMPDGGVLFTEQDADKVIRIDPAGNISTYLENTNRTIGLAYDPKGRLIGTQSRDPKVAALHPTRTVLADAFEGQPLVRPNDLVIDRKGGIYFTDPIPGANRFREPPPGRKPLLFYITPGGRLTKLTEAIEAPNGVQLSPDEKTLYATNGTHIVAFDVQPDGSVRNPRKFADSRGDGLAVDTAGRLYAAVAAGINVISPQGQILGTIPTPIGMQSAGFAGGDKRTLFAVGRGAAYKVAMIAEGIRSRAK